VLTNQLMFIVNNHKEQVNISRGPNVEICSGLYSYHCTLRVQQLTVYGITVYLYLLRTGVHIDSWDHGPTSSCLLHTS
jgi:hypothetical protein